LILSLDFVAAVPMTTHEASGRNGAALLYDWQHARLEVVFSDGEWQGATDFYLKPPLD
jgi:hypothetical protein